MCVVEWIEEIGQCPKLLVTIFRNLVKFGGYISKFGQINFKPVTKYSQMLTIFRDLTKFRNMVTKSFGHWLHAQSIPCIVSVYTA